jgi:hypothetical protein
MNKTLLRYIKDMHKIETNINLLKNVCEKHKLEKELKLVHVIQYYFRKSLTNNFYR